MRNRCTLAAVALLLAPFADARGQASVPDSRPARDKIVNWIRDNNRFGPDHAIVSDMATQVDSDIDKVNNLSLIFGGGLTRSGNPTRLDYWAGQFFVNELNGDEADALGLKPMSVNYSTGTKSRDLRQTPAWAIISRPGIRQARQLDGKSEITGAVTFTAKQPIPDKVALRMSYSVGGSTTSRFQYFDGGLPKDSNLIPFTFKGVNAELEGNDKPYAGPLVLFFDLVTVDQNDNNVTVTILSNSVAGLVDVTGGD